MDGWRNGGINGWRDGWIWGADKGIFVSASVVGNASCLSCPLKAAVTLLSAVAPCSCARCLCCQFACNQEAENEQENWARGDAERKYAGAQRKGGKCGAERCPQRGAISRNAFSFFKAKTLTLLESGK